MAEPSFNPEFTYPIFGDKEKIFGYKGLDIQVCISLANFMSGLISLALVRIRELETTSSDQLR